MSPKKDYRILYEKELLRVRVEFAAELARSLDAPPVALIARVRAKLEAERNAGTLAVGIVHQQRFERLWARLRELDAAVLPGERIVSCVVANGAPALPGLTIRAVPGGGALLTIEAPAETVATWSADWLEATLAQQRAADDAPIDRAQLHAALLRAQAGEPCKDLAIGVSAAADGDAAQPYDVRLDRARGELSVLVRDLAAIASKEAVDALVTAVKKSAATLAPGAGKTRRFVAADFKRRLAAALDGPERFGVGPPLLLLAACAVRAAPQPRQAYAGCGALSVKVADDRMEAFVAALDAAWLDQGAPLPDRDWLKTELARCGVKHGCSEELAGAFLEALSRRDKLIGLCVARGDRPQPGAEPHLHLSYKDAPPRGANVADIRETQRRTVVRAGELVAELRWRQPGKPGRDVLGNAVPAPATGFAVTTGDGIVEREPGRYVATHDGLPVIDGARIALSRVLVHKGDVNLTTGNLRFDGPIEILGSVDVGAVVECGGDVTVQGSVRQGTILCKGMVTVRDGINTGADGRIDAGQDVRAGFIESSRIVCGGTLSARRGIMMSSVIAGGSVIVGDPDGLVAGGSIACWKELRTGNLGYPRGALTRVEAGVDWRAQQARERRAGRIARVEAAVERDRKALTELEGRAPAQMTARHRELKATLRERVKRGDALIEALREHLRRAESALRTNLDAIIVVAGALAATVRICVAGHALPGTEGVAGVSIQVKESGAIKLKALSGSGGDQQAS